MGGGVKLIILLFCFFFKYHTGTMCFLVCFLFNLKWLYRHLIYILIKHNILTRLRIHVPFSNENIFFSITLLSSEDIAIKYYSKFIGLLNKNR